MGCEGSEKTHASLCGKLKRKGPEGNKIRKLGKNTPVRDHISLHSKGHPPAVRRRLPSSAAGEHRLLSIVDPFPQEKVHEEGGLGAMAAKALQG